MKTFFVLIRKHIAIIISLLFSFIFSGVIILLLGENPLSVFYIIFAGSFGSLDNLGYTLFFATPLIYTGLSFAICFRGGFFNIGMEGQLYVGAFSCAYIGLTFLNLPGHFLIPLAILFSMVAGGIFGFIPGYLKAKTGAHEVIITIMLNFIAIGLTGYLSSGPFRAEGDLIPQTNLISESAHLPRMGELLALIGIDYPKYIPLNLSFIIAVIVCFIIHFIFKYTVFGYEIKAVGFNKNVAMASGINVNLIIILTFAISGAISGLVGTNEVMGYRYRFLDNFFSWLWLYGDCCRAPWQESSGWDFFKCIIIWRNHKGWTIGRCIFRQNFKGCYLYYSRDFGFIFNIWRDVEQIKRKMGIGKKKKGKDIKFVIYKFKWNINGNN